MFLDLPFCGKLCIFPFSIFMDFAEPQVAFRWRNVRKRPSNIGKTDPEKPLRDFEGFRYLCIFLDRVGHF